MRIEVIRQFGDDTGTPGVLVVPGLEFQCDTLELPWRNNKRGESCILPGDYACQPWFSASLGRMVLRLEDKNGRKDCLVHNGNFAGDEAKGYVTQVHGCTEVGRGYGNIERPDGSVQYGILKSRTTLTELMDLIGPGPHVISYRWADSCAPVDPSDQNEDSLNKG